METGDDLFTFLSSQNSLGRTFIIYRSRWCLLTQLALMAIIPQVALTVLLRKKLTADASFFDMTDEGMLFRFLVVVPYGVFNTTIQAVMVHVVAEYYAQRHSTWKGSVLSISDRWCAILGYVAFYIVGYSCLEMSLRHLFGVSDNVLLDLLLFLLWGTMFVQHMVKMTIALPVVMVDKQQTFNALNRSDQLLSVHYWYFIGSMSLLVLPVILVVGMYSVALEKMLGTSVLSIILCALPGILFLPIRTM